MKVYFYLSILILLACSTDSQKIEKLQTENQILKDKLEKIENEINNFQFSAIGMEKNSKISLGKEYIAEIGIVISKKSYPINVQLGDIINNEFHPSGDTLTEKHSEFRIYRHTPKNIGVFQYSWKVEFDFFDSTIVRFFTMEYSVME